MGKKAIYTRLSRDKHGGMSTSTADQERECREFAARRGWRDLEVFTDHDVRASDFKRKRPAWERLRARLGEFAGLICSETSRLYRHPRDLEDLIERAEAGELTIHALRQSDVDLQSIDGRIQARTLAAFNKGEVERIAERVRRKKASLAREGKPGGSRRPFGYDRSGLALVPDEADAIRGGAEMLLNGASLSSISREWNARGLRGSSGGAFNPSSVRRMLASPRYAGLRVHQGEVLGRASWPAILTKRDHERVLRILGDPARKNGEPGPRYLLTGLLYCGREECGAQMGGRPNNRVPAYVCKGGPEGSRVHLGIVARPLEELVIRRASDLWIPEPEAVADPAALDADLLAERDEIEAKLEALGAEYARGEISAHAFRGVDKELSARLADVDRRMEESAPPRPTREYLRTIGEAEDEEAFYRDPSTRAWLETIFEKVVVLPAERLGTAAERLEGRVELVPREGVRDRRG